MTTNGDGTLYFLQDASPLSLYEIAPSNASVLNDWTPGATGGGDQALAFYGGSFYLFEDNVVYAFDTATQATKAPRRGSSQRDGRGRNRRASRGSHRLCHRFPSWVTQAARDGWIPLRGDGKRGR